MPTVDSFHGVSANFSMRSITDMYLDSVRLSLHQRIWVRFLGAVHALVGSTCCVTAKIFLPAVFAAQMAFIDYMILSCNLPLVGAIAIFVDVAFCIHLILYGGPAQAELQWMCYCWILAVKCLVCYFLMLMNREAMSSEQVTGLQQAMLVTPIFYCLRTFGTARELVSRSNKRRRSGTRASSQGFSGLQHTSMDIVLLQDMVWHVMLDLIDIADMMRLADVEDARLGVSIPILAHQNTEKFSAVRKIAGAFVFLGFFFHHQSFPKSGASKHPGRAVQEIDVVKARKRSAIVSILFVDVPFAILRLYVYGLYLSLDEAAHGAAELRAGVGNATAEDELILAERPAMNKWVVKNILFVLLQAMQLRFVQQADIEQSQDMRWWEPKCAKVAALGNPQEPSAHPALTKAWQSVDRGRLDAAMEDTGGLSTPSMVGRHLEGNASADRADGGEARELPRATHDAEKPPSNRLCCMCRRVRCRWPVLLILHGLMGLVLGWVVAKLDRQQVTLLWDSHSI